MAELTCPHCGETIFVERTSGLERVLFPQIIRQLRRLLDEMEKLLSGL